MKPANNAPIYLCLYAKLAELARAHGYAMAVHGTCARDCDLICIPWVEEPQRPAQLLRAILERWAFRWTGGPTIRPHGRVAFTLHIEHGDCYFDLQFMPATKYARKPVQTSAQ